MKDEHFVTRFFENRPSRVDTIRGIAKHACGDQWPVLAVFGNLRLDHSTDRTESAGEDDLGNPIQSRHIDNTGNHRNVLRADIVGRISTREGRNHDLRKTDGKSSHRAGTKCGPPASTEREDSVDLPFCREFRDEFGSGFTHRRDTFATILACHQGFEIDSSGSGNLEPGNIGLDGRLGARSYIDQEWGVSSLANQLGHIGMFFALRVESSQDGDDLVAFTHFLRRCASGGLL